MFQIFYSGENSIVLPIEKFPSLALPNCKTAVKWALLIGSRLYEVLNMIVEKFGILETVELVADHEERWSLTRSVRNGSLRFITKVNLGNSDKFENKSSWFRFYRQCRIWSIHVVDLQRTEKKSTKSYNARAQPLFCSFKLSFFF